jgi:hypothetical protein
VLWEYELLARERLLDRTLLLFRATKDASAAKGRALAAFQRVAAGGPSGVLPPGREPVALLQTASGPALLVAQQATAAACVVALRAHFQGHDARRLYDPALAVAGEPAPAAR